MTATPASPAASQQAAVDAALLILERMGLSPDDLAAAPRQRPAVPTFADYVPVVSATVTAGTRKAYGSYWNRVTEQWGTRRLDEPTPSEIRQLVAYVRANAVPRRNARGGRSAAENLIAALRCLYRHAEDDGLIDERDNPARKVAKPRRLPSTRRAVADTRLAEINQVAATTGDDPELDALILRLHTETACRRGGALALRPADLDREQCLVLLREKGETVRWQPVSPTLMAALAQHAKERHAPPDGRLLRYADGRPVTYRRYDGLWVRIGRHLPWVRTQQISTHWIRHTTLTWVERNFGFAVAHAYAGHTDGAGDTATSTYVRATDRLLMAHNQNVGELDHGSDRDKPTEPPLSAGSAQGGGELRLVVETRTRGEAYADLRQSAESGWDPSRRFDAPRSELAGFRAERAGLPGVSSEEASRYVERHRSGRPWLETAERASPEALRIIVAADLGGGHGHIRHEGWVMEQASMRRVAYLEDPAQLDPGKRSRGIDGLRPGGRHHICADRASRITDPDAFATALARGARHHAVRAALSTPYDQGSRPDPVWLPITDMLGKDGHRLCTGWQLEPIDGSIDAARNNRRTWRTARAEGRQPDAPEPAARPIPTFEGGTMIFVIGHNRQRNGYEIATLFPQPPAHDLPVRLARGHRRTKEGFHGSALLDTASRRAIHYAHQDRDNVPAPRS